jgi:SHS2 domain-containing protein
MVAPGDTLDELLVNWVEELLHLSREEGLALSYFVVDRLEPGGVQGSAAGLPTHEVEQLGRVPVRVVGPASPVVSIPEGFWADLTVELEPKLRLV